MGPLQEVGPRQKQDTEPGYSVTLGAGSGVECPAGPGTLADSKGTANSITSSRVGGRWTNKRASRMWSARPSMNKLHRLSSLKPKPPAKAQNRLAYTKTERSSCSTWTNGCTDQSWTCCMMTGGEEHRVHWFKAWLVYSVRRVNRCEPCADSGIRERQALMKMAGRKTRTKQKSHLSKRLLLAIFLKASEDLDGRTSHDSNVLLVPSSNGTGMNIRKQSVAGTATERAIVLSHTVANYLL